MSTESSTPSRGSAYDLLSKPIADISDDDLAIIVDDLRKRRAFYTSGKADRPDKPPKTEPTAASKKQATLDILAGLDLKLPGGAKL